MRPYVATHAVVMIVLPPNQPLILKKGLYPRTIVSSSCHSYKPITLVNEDKMTNLALCPHCLKPEHATVKARYACQRYHRALKTCLCCLELRPERTQFSALSLVCLHCETLSASEAIQLHNKARAGRDTAIRSSSAVRRTLRRKAHVATIAALGKRCSACWHYKPLSGYYVNNVRPDGVQNECKYCISTRGKLETAGHAHLWHTVRDALRALSKSQQSVQIPTVTQPPDPQ